MFHLRRAAAENGAPVSAEEVLRSLFTAPSTSTSSGSPLRAGSAYTLSAAVGAKGNPSDAASSLGSARSWGRRGRPTTASVTRSGGSGATQSQSQLPQLAASELAVPTSENRRASSGSGIKRPMTAGSRPAANGAPQSASVLYAPRLSLFAAQPPTPAPSSPPPRTTSASPPTAAAPPPSQPQASASTRLGMVVEAAVLRHAARNGAKRASSAGPVSPSPPQSSQPQPPPQPQPPTGGRDAEQTVFVRKAIVSVATPVLSGESKPLPQPPARHSHPLTSQQSASFPQHALDAASAAPPQEEDSTSSITVADNALVDFGIPSTRRPTAAMPGGSSGDFGPSAAGDSSGSDVGITNNGSGTKSDTPRQKDVPSLSNSGWTMRSSGSDAKESNHNEKVLSVGSDCLPNVLHDPAHGPAATVRSESAVSSSRGTIAIGWDQMVNPSQRVDSRSGPQLISIGSTRSVSGRWKISVPKSKWEPQRAHFYLCAYIKIKLFVQRWRLRHSSKAIDVIDNALQRFDSTEWIHIFELNGFVLMDGGEVTRSVLDEEEPIFFHLSTSHVYLRAHDAMQAMLRLSDISKIAPTEGGIILTVDRDASLIQSRTPNSNPSSPANGSSLGLSLTLLTDEGALLALHLLEFQSRLLRSYASTLSSSLRLKSIRVLHIAHFNDVYHLPPFKPAHCKGLAGGASRFHTFLSEMRKTVNPLVLFSGDFMGPSLMSVITKGKQMVDALNFLGVKYGVFGNHEFDFGLKVLKEVIHGYTKGKHIYPGSQTTWIMSNMREPDGTPLGGAKPYVLCTWQGVTIGIVGLCENWLPQCANLHPTEASYTDIFEVGETLARDLKSKGAEIVIALTHNRYDVDKELTTRCPSIDYLLGGHDHFYKNDRAHRIVKSGQEFEYLTQLEVHFPPDEKPRFKVATHPITFDIAESDYMKGLIERYDAKMAEKLGKVIGKTDIPLDSTEETVRFREGHLTNFILDVIQQAFQTDFAVLGAAAIAGKEIKPPGNVTMGDVFGWFPNETKIMVMKMKGSTIRKTLDVMVRELPAEAPSFPHPSKQLAFTINMIYHPPRCESIFINGEPLDPERFYTVAVEDFVGIGKAKYKHVAQEAEVVIDEDDAQQVVLLVLDYFQNMKPSDDVELSSRDTALRNVTKVAASAAHIGVDMDMEKSQKFIRSLICELMHCDRSSIFLVDFKSDMLHFIPDGSPQEIRFPKHVGLAGYVCTSGNSINIDDVYTDPRFNQEIDKRTGYRTKSMLACPVILDGVNCSAVVQAINKHPDRNGGLFDDIDVMMLRLLGEQIGFQLINQAIFQRALNHEKMRKAALAIFKRMASEIDESVEAAIHTHVQHAREAIKCDATRILVLNDEHTEFATTEDGIDEEDALVTLACERGTLAELVVREGHCIRANDLAQTKRAVLTKSVDVTVGSYKNALLCPMKSTDGVIIGLIMWADKRPDGFSEEDEVVGGFFAELASVAVQNAKRLEVLTQASQESALVSVPIEPIKRITIRGGWHTIAKFVRKARVAKRNSSMPGITIDQIYRIGNPIGLLRDEPLAATSAVRGDAMDRLAMSSITHGHPHGRSSFAESSSGLGGSVLAASSNAAKKGSVSNGGFMRLTQRSASSSETHHDQSNRADPLAAGRIDGGGIACRSRSASSGALSVNSAREE